MRTPPSRDDFDAWVAQLADPIRARPAFWHLVLSGDAALPAVRAGLQSPLGDVRRLCTAALDHLVDEDSFPTLIAMLRDHDPRVRVEALHALACARCKDNACRPDAAAVLDQAIILLLSDPDRHVRQMACEVVGQWVHTHEEAVGALERAKTNDVVPAVRKKASWYAPGGTIYLKSRRTFVAASSCRHPADRTGRHPRSEAVPPPVLEHPAPDVERFRASPSRRW